MISQIYQERIETNEEFLKCTNLLDIKNKYFKNEPLTRTSFQPSLGSSTLIDKRMTKSDHKNQFLDDFDPTKSTEMINDIKKVHKNLNFIKKIFTF